MSDKDTVTLLSFVTDSGAGPRFTDAQKFELFSKDPDRKQTKGIPVTRSCTCTGCGKAVNSKSDSGRLSPLAWLHHKVFCDEMQ